MTGILVRNRYLVNDVVSGATVAVDPPAQGAAPLTGTTNRWGTVNIDITGLTNGVHVMRITPTTTSTAAVGPTTANAAPPDRIFRTLDINFTVSRVNGNTRVTAVSVPAAQRANGGARLRANNPRVTVELQPVWMRSPNHRGRNNIAVDTIIIHHTGTQSTRSALNTFLRGGGTSAHYVIDHEGRIIKLVQDARRAAHAGVARWRGSTDINSRSIGIEIVHRTQDGDYPAAQYTALNALLGRITTAYPDIVSRNIIGHSDVGTNRNGVLGRKSSDPGTHFDWREIENNNYGLIPGAAANVPADLYSGFFTAVPGSSFRQGDNDQGGVLGGAPRQNVNGNPVAEIQTDLTTIGYSVGNANGSYNDHTYRAVQMFQEHFFAGGRGAQANGRVDHATAVMIKQVLNNL